VAKGGRKWVSSSPELGTRDAKMSEEVTVPPLKGVVVLWGRQKLPKKLEAATVTRVMKTGPGSWHLLPSEPLLGRAMPMRMPAVLSWGGCTAAGA
jgi:hypothetical protein